MSATYANEQPAGFVNYIRNVAIVGAGGQVGKHLTEHLIKTGKHNITALTRPDSTNTLPEGVTITKVDYTDHSSLVAALRGQDALIITMAATAPRETSSKLIQAAIDAEVPWILPNEWGLDHDNESLAEESLLGGPIHAHRKQARESIKSDGTPGVSAYIAFVNSFWYEYSLPFGPATFGFDIPNKKVIFFDQGTTKINTSSFPQCGKGLAALLSVKIYPDTPSDTSPSLSGTFRNKSAYVSSFTLSQEDMLASILRVTGDKRENWTIEHEDVQQRWKDAVKEFDGGKGPRMAFATAMYSRVFFPDGAGNFGAKKGLHNKVIGIEEEDVDVYTKVALKI